MFAVLHGTQPPTIYDQLLTLDNIESSVYSDFL